MILVTRRFSQTKFESSLSKHLCDKEISLKFNQMTGFVAVLQHFKSVTNVGRAFIALTKDNTALNRNCPSGLRLIYD